MSVNAKVVFHVRMGLKSFVSALLPLKKLTLEAGQKIQRAIQNQLIKVMTILNINTMNI